MSDEKQPEFEGEAARQYREYHEREARKLERKTPEESVAAQTGADIAYSATGRQHVQMQEPIGVIYGPSPDGNSFAQAGPYRATKANRQHVLGKHNEANDAQRDDSSWLFDT